MEPFFPRGAPESDEEEEEHASFDARARLTRARSSSEAGPREANALTFRPLLLLLPLSPRSLALGSVVASLMVYVCVALLIPSPATSRLALRVAGLDPAGGRSSTRSSRRSDLPDYLSPFDESRRNGRSGSRGNSAFEAAAEVAASDSLLPLPPTTSPPSRAAPSRVHVLVTSNGSPYLNYQTRLLFASWQRMKAAAAAAAGEEGLGASSSTMAGFTRILHRTSDDALCREVPTLRVAPRTPACDDWCPFPVADRPEAVRSFFAAVRSSRSRSSRGGGGGSSGTGDAGLVPGMEEGGDEGAAAGSLFYFLAETDYLFLRPLRVPSNLFSADSSPSSPSSSPSSPSSASSSQLFDGVAFPFGYIQPQSGVVAPILERLFSLSGGEKGASGKKRKSGGGAPSSSSPTGPSPVLLPLRGWLRLLPAWVSFAEAIEQDLEARDVLGWIREMYAFSAAAAFSGVKLDLVPPPVSVFASSSSSEENSIDDGRAPLILQPPEDEQIGSAAAIHYTWGTRIVRIEGEEGEGEEEEEEDGSKSVGGGAAATAATETGERLVWEFDKRKTTEASAVELLPRPQALPESFDPRWRLAGSKGARGWQRGKKVSRALFETLKVQVREINACIDWIQERDGRAASHPADESRG